MAAFENRFARIETDLTPLKWMVGGLYALLPPAGGPLPRVARTTGALS